MATLPISALQGGVRPVATDLPKSTYEGIGKVISAASILEHQVSELLFYLMKVGYPEGRVAFKYAGASTMFSTIRRLIDLHGINPKGDMAKLEAAIKDDCCKPRDKLAHGIWLQGQEGLGVRITEGKFDEPGGKRDAAFLPHCEAIDDPYYEDTRQRILAIVEQVSALKSEVKAALAIRGS